MTFDQIIKDLENKKFRPVYFLQGEEAYFIDLISDFIENNVLNESERSFDQTIVYGRDTDKTSVVSLAKQFPMMAQYQVIIVKEAQDLKDLAAKGKTAAKKKEQDALEAYLEHPQPSTILVFCHKYKKLAKNTTLYKMLEKFAIVLDSDLLKEDKVPDWIRQFVQQKGFSITPKAALLLSEYLGNDLSKITNEIGKLIISLTTGATINENLIEANIGISKDYNSIELQKAIVERN
ncbi:MAG: DNA polymerase III subunit delta, partial [Bacteroidales bacterium]|nr:DNA polymerase III subunit delta [Bacteroidales bacterium]